MKKLLVTISIIINAILWNSCGMSDDAIGKVGKFEISKNEFMEELQRRFQNRLSTTVIDSATKMNVLKPIVLNKQKLNDAYALDLDDDEEIQKSVAGQRDNFLYSKYFEREIVDQLLPDEEIRKYYDDQKEQVKASHILISYEGSSNKEAKRSKEEALKLASQIYERLKNGEDFTKLVLEYSDDRSKEANKGDLGYFSKGKMIPEFDRAVFSMEVGAISEPVETQYGYHIIRLEEKRDDPRMANSSFEKEYMNIKRTMYRSVAQEASKLWQKHSDSLKNAIGFELVEVNVNRVPEIVNRLSVTSGAITEDAFSEEDRNLILARWNNGEYTLGKLANEFGNIASQFKQRVSNLNQLKQVVDNRGVFFAAVDLALKRGYDREKDIVEELDKVKERQMLVKVQKVQVNDKVEVTEEEKIAYYEEHKEEFVRNPKIEIWEIHVKDESLAKKIAGWAKSGRNFEQLAKKYSTDKGYKDKGGYIGYKEKTHRGTVSREAFKVGPNSVGGPVKYRNNWVVFKTGALTEKEYKAYEEAQSQVQSKLAAAKNKERREQWETELEEEYPLVINQKVWDAI